MGSIKESVFKPINYDRFLIRFIQKTTLLRGSNVLSFLASYFFIPLKGFSAASNPTCVACAPFCGGFAAVKSGMNVKDVGMLVSKEYAVVAAATAVHQTLPEASRHRLRRSQRNGAAP
jgi:hypothetical protein